MINKKYLLMGFLALVGWCLHLLIANNYLREQVSLLQELRVNEQEVTANVHQANVLCEKVIQKISNGLGVDPEKLPMWRYDLAPVVARRVNSRSRSRSGIGGFEDGPSGK